MLGWSCAAFSFNFLEFQVILGPVGVVEVGAESLEWE